MGVASIVAAMTAGAQVTVQDPNDVVGTGDQQWSYMVLEGEDYETKLNEDPASGFTRVDSSEAVTSFLGGPILGADTTASKKGALWTQTAFAKHIDKVTYQVQFAKAGTYYLYMRFSMFENGGNVDHYLNEDSFFLPPGFDLDPQTDWPLSEDGGYTEGCCDGGFLTIKEDGTPVNRSGGGEEGQAFWEGRFHWNELTTSQFLAAELGEAGVRHKYEVTEAMVGQPLTWTVSYREGGAAIDLWLFSTNPNLMDDYAQTELDELLLPAPIVPAVTIQDPGNVVGTGADEWSYLALEGEDYDSELDGSPDSGFARVDDTGTVTSFLGSPILAPDTTASGKGALWTQTVFSRHIDKITYQVQFAKAGTYYLYMRFSMFENGGNVDHYLNEDSFFLPPEFDKDPQTDWPLSDDGGYTEGCCDGGYLTIKEDGAPVNHSGGGEEGQAFWEGRFHWNELSTSQFLAEDRGEAGIRHKYEVTEAMLGKPLNWTVSYREGGTAIDLWLFSTNPDLMDDYTQAELDGLLLSSSSAESVAISRDGGNVMISWPVAASGYALEATPTLVPANFIAVTNPPVVTGDRNTITVEATEVSRYYRLRKP